MRRTDGWTLPETLAALAVVALLAAATPALRGLLLDARMTSAVNSLVHAIHLARQQAHVSLRDVVVCRGAAGVQCAPAGNWSSGWLVFVNFDRDDPPVIDPGEPVLHATDPQSLRSVQSNRRAFVMRPFSLRATNGTVVFCDERGTAHARAVIVSYTGRPRAATRSAGGRPLTCPP